MDALEASIDFAAVAEVARVSEDGNATTVRGRPVQLVRPGDSIQDAIDEAPAGGIVLVRRGTYEIEESITITKSLRLVGLGGPGAVVIAEKPGLTERPRNGISVRSESSVHVQDVSIVNVTVRGFTGNGIFMARVDGFLLHRVITDQLGGPDQDGGAYGLFPVRSRNGLITHCTATRADDSGIYVGQSENVAVVHNEAYGNVIGLEAENVKRTVWAHNRAYDNAAGMLAILLPIDPTDEYPIVDTFAEQLYVAHNRFTDNNGPELRAGRSGRFRAVGHWPPRLRLRRLRDHAQPRDRQPVRRHRTRQRRDPTRRRRSVRGPAAPRDDPAGAAPGQRADHAQSRDRQRLGRTAGGDATERVHRRCARRRPHLGQAHHRPPRDGPYLPLR